MLSCPLKSRRFTEIEKCCRWREEKQKKLNIKLVSTFAYGFMSVVEWVWKLVRVLHELVVEYMSESEAWTRHGGVDCSVFFLFFFTKMHYNGDAISWVNSQIISDSNRIRIIMTLEEAPTKGYVKQCPIERRNRMVQPKWEKKENNRRAPIKKEKKNWNHLKLLLLGRCVFVAYPTSICFPCRPCILHYSVVDIRGSTSKKKKSLKT